MAKDVTDVMRDALGNAVREAVKNVGDVSSKPKKRGKGSSPFSGAKGLAAGAGLAAAAPLAKKGVDKVRKGGLGALSPTKAASKAVSNAGEKVGSSVKDTVSKKVDEAGGAGGIAKEAASGLIPGLGGGGSDSGGGNGGLPGVGKGRRMPIQQSIDVAVPLETAYNQFSQFEDWPEFMHRVTRVTKDDDCNVSFATKIWGKTKEFKAQIETQRPDERIKWRVSQGITHAGVVTFHELAPRLTRIEVSLDVAPGSLLEKAARGMRHIKRAIRADLHRYKAFIEMQEHETGAWRGVIEDGELIEEHDPEYDEYREYSDVEDLQALAPDDDDEDKDEDDDDAKAEAKDEDADEEGEEQLPRDKSGRFTRGAGARSDRDLKRTNGNGAKTRAKSKPSSSKSASPRSRSRGASNGSSSSKRSSGTSSSTRRRSSSRS